MKKKILSGVFALALLATIGFGVNKSMKSDARLSDLALSNVEALASGESNEWNHWSQWLSQGLTKDEREWQRPCPSESSGSGNVNVNHNGTGIGAGGSYSQTNPSTRSEITCPYGNDNCSRIRC